MKTLNFGLLKAALFALLCLLTLNAHGHGYTLGDLKIIHPWARATVPGQANGGAYLQIDNTGAADRLISAQVDVAGATELHQMSMDGEVMRMQKLENGIDLPAKQKVELKPGGLHIMLLGLKAPLKEGDKLPLRLKFEKAGEITVEIHVAAAGATPEHMHH